MTLTYVTSAPRSIVLPATKRGTPARSTVELMPCSLALTCRMRASLVSARLPVAQGNHINKGIDDLP